MRFRLKTAGPSDSASPTVTVIIATYNWSSVLRYAIRSVLWQTHQDFELLVVGDACTDDSAEVVASFQDPRIRWHNRETNSGCGSGPNNSGLAMARGAYVAYLGHDDIWHPTHLSALVEAMKRTAADLAFTQCVMIGPPGSNFRIVTGVYRRGRYQPGTGIPPSSILHRRDMVEKTGGWRDYRELVEAPDTEFVHRAHRCGKRFEAVPQLSVFKFNASLRRNSYREKPCHEQADYLRRIQEEPDFLEKEWRAIEAVRGLPHRLPDMPEAPDGPTPGWRVSQWRRVRGLDP